MILIPKIWGKSQVLQSTGKLALQVDKATAHSGIYGMSQFADGGLMSTKPYISGSNYLMKMSDYKKGEWQAIWDGLFWRFMHVHRDFFLKNPRLGMLIRSFDAMDTNKQQTHLNHAEQFLNSL